MGNHRGTGGFPAIEDAASGGEVQERFCEPELKPCPFCFDGGEPKLTHDTSSDYSAHWAWHVWCKECGAETDYRQDENAARNLWNQRSALSQPALPGQPHPLAAWPDGTDLGLYRVFWKSGGSSEAAIGMMSDGKRWIAATNWVAPGVMDASASEWADIERLERVHPLAPEVHDTGGLVEPTVFIDEQGVAQVIEGHGDAIKALFAAMSTPRVGRKVLALVPAVSRAEAAAELSRLRERVAELERQGKMWDKRDAAQIELIDGLREELLAVSNAIGSVEFMDPPDGGSVTLAEQVARMRSAITTLRERVAELELLNRSKIVSYRDEQTDALTAATEDNKRLREALDALRASAVASGPAWVVESIDAALEGSKR